MTDRDIIALTALVATLLASRHRFGPEYPENNKVASEAAYALADAMLAAREEAL